MRHFGEKRKSSKYQILQRRLLNKKISKAVGDEVTKVRELVLMDKSFATRRNWTPTEGNKATWWLKTLTKIQ